MDHALKMALACAGLLALLFLLPQLGVQNEFTPILLVAVMLAAHYFMMRGHSAHAGRKGQEHGGH